MKNVCSSVKISLREICVNVIVYLGADGLPLSNRYADSRPYQCQQCGRFYKWKQTLMRHMRLECGKDPTFYCPFCPHKAKVKSNLDQHIRVRHHIDPVQQSSSSSTSWSSKHYYPFLPLTFNLRAHFLIKLFFYKM